MIRQKTKNNEIFKIFQICNFFLHGLYKFLILILSF